MKKSTTGIVAAILFSGHPYIGRHYRASLIEHCSTLRGRIKGAARSIISILRTVRIYSTVGGD